MEAFASLPSAPFSTTISSSSLVLFLWLIIHLPFSLHATSSNFSIGLIHPNSPLSPLYISSETGADRLWRAIRGSKARWDYFRSKMTMMASATNSNTVGDDDFYSTLMPIGPAYLMKMSLGNPPQEVMAIADTGSDLIWTPCNPCTHCVKPQRPPFDPNASRTFDPIPCTSPKCQAFVPQNCSQTHRSCSYGISYGDGSYATGILSFDALWLQSIKGSLESFNETMFGCTHNSSSNHTLPGVVGLGRGYLSLVSQLNSSIHGMFGYCLVPYSSCDNSTSCDSKLIFGNAAQVSGEGTVSARLFSLPPPFGTFYFLSLMKITVENYSKPITVNDSIRGDPNIIVDLGTTLTYLPTPSYKDLLSALNETIKLPRVEVPAALGLDLCYNFSRSNDQQSSHNSIPEIKFKFKGAAQITLRTENAFVPVNELGVICAAFHDSIPVYGRRDIGIFGNVAQANFKIGYDLHAKRIKFKPMGCAAIKT